MREGRREGGREGGREGESFNHSCEGGREGGREEGEGEGGRGGGRGRASTARVLYLWTDQDCRQGESFNRSCGAAHHLQYYICGPIKTAGSVVRERGREGGKEGRREGGRGGGDEGGRELQPLVWSCTPPAVLYLWTDQDCRQCHKGEREGRREGGKEGGREGGGEGMREGESFNLSCGAVHHLQYYIRRHRKIAITDQCSLFERRSAFTVHGNDVHRFLAIQPASHSVSKR